MIQRFGRMLYYFKMNRKLKNLKIQKFRSLRYLQSLFFMATYTSFAFIFIPYFPA